MVYLPQKDVYSKHVEVVGTVTRQNFAKGDCLAGTLFSEGLVLVLRSERGCEGMGLAPESFRPLFVLHVISLSEISSDHDT